MRRRVVHGGTLVTPDDIVHADILIENERIVRVAPAIEEPEAEVISAEGYFILPGLIDAHVHLRDPGATHKEDWATGTRAAIAGGVTTILDMPNNPQPTVDRASLQVKRALARSKALCDYGFYVGATQENAEEANDPALGAVGIKLYLGATTGDLLVTDFGSLYRHFTQPGSRPIVVHAEDNEALRVFGKEAARTRHSDKRPDLCASLAVSRVLAIAEASSRQLHIAHTSTAGEIELIQAARARGMRVSFEVTPQHLFLSTADEERLGPFGIVNPPLRSPENVRALWEHLSSCDMIATDHAPHTIEEKQSANPPSGMPGLETLLPLLLTAANEKRLSLQDIARLTSQGPARVFGLARKGQLLPGYDADLVLFRPEEEHILGKPWQTKCNWSPFEGRRARGKVARVLIRGRDALVDGEIVGNPQAGREIDRERA